MSNEYVAVNGKQFGAMILAMKAKSDAAKLAGKPLSSNEIKRGLRNIVNETKIEEENKDG